MRIRYLKNTEEIVAASPFVVQEPTALKGQWREEAERLTGVKPTRLVLEIGSGRCGFIRGLASREPDAFFLGMERISTILARAVATFTEEEKNVRLLRADALELLDIFDEGEIDALYLNFSDPWPKERHAHRRLTSDRFLPLYAKVLRAGGRLEFKTDNDELFAFSLESLPANGWDIIARTDDLHAPGNPLADGNVMTEYEKNFSELGKKIHKLVAVYKG